MIIIKKPDYIRCRLGSGPDNRKKSAYCNLEVFYAETSGLFSRYPNLKDFISKDERLRAERFRFDSDRETYIACHSLLRLAIAERLNVNPFEINYISGYNKKPLVEGNSMFFNITHTKHTFAFAISENDFVGIDLESFTQDMEVRSIARRFFSKKESEFIFKSKTGINKRFFLLWTRKEAMLKALGFGITNNLPEMEVSEKDNHIKQKALKNLKSDHRISDVYIYSKMIKNYYLSIALPHKASINFYFLNKDNIISFPDL
jgi:4'-phosphopantetheinyl transferase